MFTAGLRLLFTVMLEQRAWGASPHLRKWGGGIVWSPLLRAELCCILLDNCMSWVIKSRSTRKSNLPPPPHTHTHFFVLLPTSLVYVNNILLVGINLPAFSLTYYLGNLMFFKSDEPALGPNSEVCMAFQAFQMIRLIVSQLLFDSIWFCLICHWELYSKIGRNINFVLSEPYRHGTLPIIYSPVHFLIQGVQGSDPAPLDERCRLFNIGTKAGPPCLPVDLSAPPPLQRPCMRPCISSEQGHQIVSDSDR